MFLKRPSSESSPLAVWIYNITVYTYIDVFLQTSTEIINRSPWHFSNLFSLGRLPLLNGIVYSFHILNGRSAIFSTLVPTKCVIWDTTCICICSNLNIICVCIWTGKTGNGIIWIIYIFFKYNFVTLSHRTLVLIQSICIMMVLWFAWCHAILFFFPISMCVCL